MAPPLQAWRRTPANRHFKASSVATLGVNRGFTPPAKARVYRKLKRKMGPKGVLAAGVLPAVAGLGALIGGLVTSQ